MPADQPSAVWRRLHKFRQFGFVIAQNQRFARQGPIRQHFHQVGFARHPQTVRTIHHYGPIQHGMDREAVVFRVAHQYIFRSGKADELDV